MKFAMELIMMVKRTHICRTCNGPVDQEDEHVALSNNLNFKRVINWLSGILATEVMVPRLACFENHENKNCRLW